MRISKQELSRIIKEEIQAELSEGREEDLEAAKHMAAWMPGAEMPGASQVQDLLHAAVKQRAWKAYTAAKGAYTQYEECKKGCNTKDKWQCIGKCPPCDERRMWHELVTKSYVINPETGQKIRLERPLCRTTYKGDLRKPVPDDRSWWRKQIAKFS